MRFLKNTNKEATSTNPTRVAATAITVVAEKGPRVNKGFDKGDGEGDLVSEGVGVGAGVGVGGAVGVRLRVDVRVKVKVKVEYGEELTAIVWLASTSLNV